MQINIEVEGLDTLTQELSAYRNRVKNTQPLMLELSNHLYNIVEESFEKEQTPDGNSWSPIKPRKSDRNPSKILFDEGTMQDSLYLDATNDTSTIALNATSNGYPYAIVHQFGTEDGKIKARAFFPIHKDGSLYDGVEDELFEIVKEFVEF